MHENNALFLAPTTGMSRARRLAGNCIWKHNRLSVASLALCGLALGSGNEFVVTQEPRLSFYTRM